jgi:hypothetical protein
MPNVSDESRISYRGLKFDSETLALLSETLTLLFGTACPEGIRDWGCAA